MTTEQIMEGGGYEIADKVELWLEKHPGYFSASRIARGVHESTHTLYPILGWMLRNQYIKAAGNGCWINYTAR